MDDAPPPPSSLLREQELVRKVCVNRGMVDEEVKSSVNAYVVYKDRASVDKVRAWVGGAGRTNEARNGGWVLSTTTSIVAVEQGQPSLRKYSVQDLRTPRFRSPHPDRTPQPLAASPYLAHLLLLLFLMLLLRPYRKRTK